MRMSENLRRQRARLIGMTSAALAVMVRLTTSGLGTDAFFQNPVLAGDHPDPSIIRVGLDFWATSTSSEWGPQFPLLHSTDLVNWELMGSVFPHRPEWATANFWAPEISEFKGRYYVYYVGRKRGGPLAVAVAIADKPSGPYTDHGPLVAQEDGSIDPVPVTDTNGVRYLVWKEDGNSRNRPTPIWAQKLNDEGTRLVGDAREFIRNDAAWEGKLVEGPFILRRNGWFYLFYSGNGCCGLGCNYALGVARAHSLFGPWEKNPGNPILDGNETWKCPGHGSIVTDASGRYWLLYHAYSTSGSVFTGREGMLDEVKFGPDDWPTINGGKGPSAKSQSPMGETQRRPEGRFFDDFRGRELRKDWQWPQDQEPRYSVKDGRLRLSVPGETTNILGATLARATTSPDYVASTTFETKPVKSGWRVGLCAFGDSQNAMGAAFGGGRIVTWRSHKGVTRELGDVPAPAAQKLHLRLTARRGYHFQVAVSADGQTWIPCGEAADAKDLPPWDRSVRVALTVGGAPDAEGIFDSFSINPRDASSEK
jgi:xylan 1,4-beta-xylosidase